MGVPSTLIFDIGKTNKKLFLFDPDYNVIYQEYTQFDEITDDDGFPSEDLNKLVLWIRSKTDQLLKNAEYDINHLNFSTYGASLVHIDKNGKVVTPFYNYLKPFPAGLDTKFLNNSFGSKERFSVDTSSPYLEMLNSGLQLFFLKYHKPGLFKNIHRSLHFPQFLSFLFTNEVVSDYTSLGCHTGMWDFKAMNYSNWLNAEGISNLLPPVKKSYSFRDVIVNNRPIRVGIGVHDSSSALVPYLQERKEPFALISTGTWSICMNPFNKEALTFDELKLDCLQFLRYDGYPVKASRLFLGKQHDEFMVQFSKFYKTENQYYTTIKWNNNFKSKRTEKSQFLFNHNLLDPERFGYLNNPDQKLSIFDSFDDAYHHLMDELTDLQVASLNLVLGSAGINQILIDGGFSANEIYLNMLRNKLPEFEVSSANIPNGTALGAAILVNQQL